MQRFRKIKQYSVFLLFFNYSSSSYNPESLSYEQKNSLGQLHCSNGAHSNLKHCRSSCSKNDKDLAFLFEKDSPFKKRKLYTSNAIMEEMFAHKTSSVNASSKNQFINTNDNNSQIKEKIEQKLDDKITNKSLDASSNPKYTQDVFQVNYNNTVSESLQIYRQKYLLCGLEVVASTSKDDQHVKGEDTIDFATENQFKILLDELEYVEAVILEAYGLRKYLETNKCVKIEVSIAQQFIEAIREFKIEELAELNSENLIPFNYQIKRHIREKIIKLYKILMKKIYPAFIEILKNLQIDSLLINFVNVFFQHYDKGSCNQLIFLFLVEKKINNTTRYVLNLTRSGNINFMGLFVRIYIFLMNKEEQNNVRNSIEFFIFLNAKHEKIDWDACFMKYNVIKDKFTRQIRALETKSLKKEDRLLEILEKMCLIANTGRYRHVHIYRFAIRIMSSDNFDFPKYFRTYFENIRNKITCHAGIPKKERLKTYTPTIKEFKN